MAIERPQINLTYGVAGRAHEGQPRRTGQQRRFDSWIKRWPRLARRSAVPDADELFSLDGIAAKLALALFLFGAHGGGSLARHPTLIEAHGAAPLKPQPPLI
jgi:hypothetical protein